MKVFIWISCFFVATILNGLLGYATGIKAGYLVFYLGVVFVARKLCEKYDEHKLNNPKKEKVYFQNSLQFNETQCADNSIRFCRKCGEELLNGSKYCRMCGTEVRNK